MTPATEHRVEILRRKLAAALVTNGHQSRAVAIQEEIDRLEAGGAL